MVKTSQEKTAEIFELFERRANTTFFTDNEIEYMQWLCEVSNETAHETLVGLLKKINPPPFTLNRVKH